MIQAALLSPFNPRTALLLRRAMRRSGAFLSHTFGRTVLDEVEIPAYIQHASARAKRLVRQARVSPW